MIELALIPYIRPKERWITFSELVHLVVLPDTEDGKR
jgi:hypothetical protein